MALATTGAAGWWPGSARARRSGNRRWKPRAGRGDRAQTASSSHRARSSASTTSPGTRGVVAVGIAVGGVEYAFGDQRGAAVGGYVAQPDGEGDDLGIAATRSTRRGWPRSPAARQDRRTGVGRVGFLGALIGGQHMASSCREHPEAGPDCGVISSSSKSPQRRTIACQLVGRGPTSPRVPVRAASGIS